MGPREGITTIGEGDDPIMASSARVLVQSSLVRALGGILWANPGLSRKSVWGK